MTRALHLNKELNRVLSEFAPSSPIYVGGLEILAKGSDKPISNDERKSMLERSRAGEQIELEFEATTYIQREEPNRNFVRFKPGMLRSFAKSGIGTVFLADHRQGALSNRGGVVTKSRLEKVGDEYHIVQAVKLTAPWAVQALLEGNIDRFSIGWNNLGPMLYSHNGKEIEGWPDHWPGEKLEDGTVVEWIMTAAELVEVSAVNVPAVRGTGIYARGRETNIKEFQAALSAALGGSPSINSGRSPRLEKPMDELMKALGLSADASEASALAAVRDLENKLKAAGEKSEALELELGLEKKSHAKAKEALDKLEASEAKRAKERIDEALEAAYKDGRLSYVGDKREPDEREADLREAAEKLGFEKFERLLSGMRSSIPTGKQAEDKSEGADPTASTLGISERQRSMILSMGMTVEEWAENMKKGGLN